MAHRAELIALLVAIATGRVANDLAVRAV